MDFWFWFQISVAVMVGNALTASIAYFLMRLYRHEILQGKNQTTLPPVVYLFIIVPLALGAIVVANLPV